MGETTGTPLSGPPPEEIPLPRAPLVRVVAQISFPTLLIIKAESNVSAFQERVRNVYPVLKKDEIQSARVQISQHGQDVQRETSVIYRFADADGDWRISLATEFVALETSEYVSRDDFLARLEIVLRAVEDIFRPSFATRIGLRYVDQLKDDAFNSAGELIKPEAMGISALIHPDRVRRAAAEVQLDADEGSLLVRWVQLPEGVTYDPDIVPPIGTASWVLDLDLSSTAREEFKADHLVSALRSFAERIYAMFRFMITDEFMEHYGGKK